MADPTPAARKLAELCSPPPTSQADLARRLGITPQAVSSWITGRTRPAPAVRRTLEQLLGIPVAQWLTPEELGAPPPHTASDFAPPADPSEAA